MVFGQWESNGDYNYQYFDATNIPKLSAGTGKVYTQLCMNYTNTDLFASAQNGDKYTIGVANCQIFGVEVGFNLTPVTPPLLTNQNQLKCLSCRPGYKATNDANNTFIIACDVIPNCDQTAGTNKWMNVCQTCDTNHQWSYDTTSQLLDHAACIDSSNAPNCHILDVSDDTNCLMCSTGFALMDDGTCFPEAVKSTKNCFDFAGVYPYTALKMEKCDNHLGNDSQKNNCQTLDYMNYLAVKHSWNQNYECAMCEPGYTLMYTPKTEPLPFYSNHYTNQMGRRATKHHEVHRLRPG